MYNIFRELELDFTEIDNLEKMHNLLMNIFGFPVFYGKNVNALIDCLSDLRVQGEKGETLCDFKIKTEEIIILNCKNFSYKSSIIQNHFITAIESINKREIEIGNIPSIFLNFN